MAQIKVKTILKQKENEEQCEMSEGILFSVKEYHFTSSNINEII